MVTSSLLVLWHRTIKNLLPLLVVAIGVVIIANAATTWRFREYAMAEYELGTQLLKKLKSQNGENGSICTQASLDSFMASAEHTTSLWGSGLSLGCYQQRFVVSYSVFEPICSYFVEILLERGETVLIDGAPISVLEKQCARAGAVAFVLPAQNLTVKDMPSGN